MAAPIPSNTNFPTAKQVPDQSILNKFDKQTYLGNQFSYCLSASTGGTGEVALLYLANPLTAKVSLFVNLRRTSGATASENNILKTYIGPTISSPGTTQTANNARPASGNLSIATLQSAPTASANGTLVEGLTVAAFTTVQSDVLIILDPGQSLLITGQSSSTATLITELHWIEL